MKQLTNHNSINHFKTTMMLKSTVYLFILLFSVINITCSSKVAEQLSAPYTAKVVAMQLLNINGRHGTLVSIRYDIELLNNTDHFLYLCGEMYDWESDARVYVIRDEANSILNTFKLLLPVVIEPHSNQIFQVQGIIGDFKELTDKLIKDYARSTLLYVQSKKCDSVRVMQGYSPDSLDIARAEQIDSLLIVKSKE
jgi:hypothetical protein